LPYGIPNFAKIAAESYIYVDKTPFIRKLEDAGEPYIFYLRPRKFGKSLFVSTLEYYYDLKHADKFEMLFGDFHIGANPTPLHNSYMILLFDFSGIDTTTRESTYQGFRGKVKLGVEDFWDKYEDLLGVEDRDEILNINEPERMVGELIQRVRRKTGRKIYLLVDEYDHFANELLAFRFDMFRELVSRTGFVRKFYEVLKTGARDGVIDRMFITGVTPITLDSLTSGFNIARNLSLDEEFHPMLGFTEDETRRLIWEVCSHCSADPDEIYSQMSDYYNGHRFCAEADDVKLFNPDMVLYYLSDYRRYDASEKYEDHVAPRHGSVLPIRLPEILSASEGVDRREHSL